MPLGSFFYVFRSFLVTFALSLVHNSFKSVFPPSRVTFTGDFQTLSIKDLNEVKAVLDEKLKDLDAIRERFSGGEDTVRQLTKLVFYLIFKNILINLKVS